MLPIDLEAEGPRVMVVLDGLGWDQLEERRHLTPTLNGMSGGHITTVAPSTTATALTSITTGATPGEHGVVGYRMMIGGEVINSLRWRGDQSGDVRRVFAASDVQPIPPFLGESLPLVVRAEFATTGFTQAHLRGGHHVGYRTVGTLIHEVGRLVSEGAQRVYAYYDGIDKVSHEYGLGSTFDRELAFADGLLAGIMAEVPSGTSVIVTADHGQVDCGHALLPLHPRLRSATLGLSGEGRFRWLHGSTDDLASMAREFHGDVSWVFTAEELIDGGWFGPILRPEVRRRLGDVALLPFEPIAFEDPADTGPYVLVGRHGSVTSAEMRVPCLIASG